MYGNTPKDHPIHRKRAYQDKVKKSMHKFEDHTLHSGSKHGPVVTNRKQAIAIGLSEQRKGKK